MVREAGQRVLGMRHFDVQMVGGMVLQPRQDRRDAHRRGQDPGRHPAPPTSTPCPAKGVHVVTVNDYLARRDAAWMGRVYHFLGLTRRASSTPPGARGRTPPPTSSTPSTSRRRARAIATCARSPAGRPTPRTSPTAPTTSSASTICATTWPSRPEQRTQRDPFYAIVDEVDSILIDEARTPLIISGPSEGSTDLYKQIDAHHPAADPPGPHHQRGGQAGLRPGRLLGGREGAPGLPERGRPPARRGDAGRDRPAGARATSLYDATNIVLMHHVYAALRAHALFQRNVEYIVRDGQIIIVDEFTGRTMPGPALVRGAAPGGRGQGGGADPGRRTRRWPPSPSRTCSASTPSSRA